MLSLPQPTRIQNDIAKYLAGGPRRRFIAAFRGVAKTFLAAAYVVWRLWNDPELKIMVVSANERFATKIAAFIHTIIYAEDTKTRQAVPWAELRPRPGQKNSVLEFDVGPARPSKDPSVFAVGITGQMTGGRADIILSDDVEVPTNSATEAQREKLEDATKEYADILKPGGEVIYLGTFQSMQSIYRKLRSKGYAMRVWPARYPLKERAHVYEDALAPMLQDDLEADPTLQEPRFGSQLGGAPTDTRFPVPELIEREIEKREAGFLLQFMLDTSLSDAERFPLKTADLVVMDTSRDLAPQRVAWGSGPDQVLKIDNVGFDGDRLHRPIYVSGKWDAFTGSTMEIDPSGRGDDETAYVVTKFLNGLVYVRRWGGFRDGHSDETLGALAEIAKEERVNLIRVEDDFGDGMFGQLLLPHLARVKYRVPVEGFKAPRMMKESRIMNQIRAPLKQHRIVIDTQVIRDDIEQYKRASTLTREEGRSSQAEYSGLYQLTHLTEARGALRHDDRVEVLANAMGYWAQYLNADAEEAERAAEEKAVKEYEEMLWRTAVGKPWPTEKKRGAGRPVSRGRHRGRR